MSALTAEKLKQAETLTAQSGADVWLTFVRETDEGGDPVLPLILDGGLVWQSALLVTARGERIAIVGNYDADPLNVSGDWQEVIPYIQSIREPLCSTLERLIPDTRSSPKIAVNYSPGDVKADGLSHGMYLLLEEYLRGTRFEGCLVSAEPIVMGLRGLKTATEIGRIRASIAETERLFAEAEAFAKIGVSERAVYRFVQERIDSRGLGYSWCRASNPIVNSGPDSMAGHGIPSDTITLAPGHIFHIDLGVVREGYSSDIQRCWYVAAPGERTIPADIQQAMAAVTGAISAGAAVLRPGIEGWKADEAARAFLKESGYPEYMHALGHQVGRAAHDGGAILGPRWERYGNTPFLPIQQDQVYTVELGVNVAGRGYLGIEEMVLITEDGVEWLTQRQLTVPLLSAKG
jgi:Xaa-Pro aminopeptidase